jgi:hypothetical protein
LQREGRSARVRVPHPARRSVPRHRGGGARGEGWAAGSLGTAVPWQQGIRPPLKTANGPRKPRELGLDDFEAGSRVVVLRPRACRRGPATRSGDNARTACPPPARHTQPAASPTGKPATALTTSGRSGRFDSRANCSPDPTTTLAKICRSYPAWMVALYADWQTGLI